MATSATSGSVLIMYHIPAYIIPRLGVESQLQLPAYATAIATATATPDLSCIWYLRCSVWQHWILNPLSKVRDQTCILGDSMLGF